MDIEENKLQNFEQLIIKEAEEKRDAVLKQIDEEKRAKLNKVRAELEQNYEQHLSREKLKVDKAVNEQNAALQTKQKKEILNVREKHIDNVFVNVLIKINEYIKTDKYREDIDRKIKKIMEKLSDDFILIISNNDEKLKELSYKFETTEEHFYGGCRIIDKKKGIQVDLTNKSKLENSRVKFLETHKLKL